jgi:hypothetical protein
MRFVSNCVLTCPLLVLPLLLACSGGADDAEPNDPQAEMCNGQTDLTQGTIDGPACEMAYDVLGKSDQIESFDTCTEYLFESTLADEEGTCDRTNLLGYCVNVDDRDSSQVTIIYRYTDPGSSLSHCDDLELKSYQCLNRAANTWCNVK